MLGYAVLPVLTMMLIEGWMDAVVVVGVCPREGTAAAMPAKLKSLLVCVYTYSRYNMCNHVQALSTQPHRKNSLGNYSFMCAETSTHFIPLENARPRSGFPRSRMELGHWEKG